MKLIDILVRELPKRGGWPEGADYVVQDNDGSLDVKFGSGEATLEHDRRGVWVNDMTPDWGIDTHESYIRDFNILACDSSTTIITREQYEAALAESKHCVHDWIPSEGRTASGYLCRKCGDYNGPESEVKTDADGWIDWGGGECPVERGTMVDVRYRNGCECHHVGAGLGADTTGSDPDHCANDWYADGTDWDIIAYRLHKLQEVTEADDEADLNECIGQDVAQVWNGEGLPPVGMEIEYSFAKVNYRTDFSRGKVLAYGMQNVFMEHWASKNEFIQPLDKIEFRPIRSESDRKRDAAKNAIAELCRSSSSNGHSADLIYDAIAAGKITGLRLED